jgi:hypothetical protein
MFKACELHRLYAKKISKISDLSNTGLFVKPNIFMHDFNLL